MAEIKKTQKEFYARLMEVVEDANPVDKDELIDFCEGRIELLAKKNAGGAKVNPLTEKVKDFMVDYMEENSNEILTCSQIANKATKALKLVEPVTPQRVSAIMKKLVAEGFVEEVKKSQYTKA